MASQNYHESACHKVLCLKKSGNQMLKVFHLLIWIVTTHVASTTETSSRCEGLNLLSEVEGCIDPLHTLNNFTVLGSLTREQWSMTCRTYTTSMQCLTELHRQCETDQSLDVDTGLQHSLRAGLGELCMDGRSFVVYQNHEKCFETHTQGVKQCKETFFFQMNQLLENISALPTEDSKEMLCVRYDDFQRCITSTLSSPCGHQAAQFYCGLLRAQVPLHILSMCNIDSTILKHTDDADFSRGCDVKVTPVLLFALVTIIASALL